MALRDLGADFEHYRVVEFDKFAIASYNAIHGTDFPTIDITKISGADLCITDTDKYCYIMTYSFPCQDLSTAGKQRGMRKGSGTRSGLLWEVERLLNEVENLPQVLLMENVPQVHGQSNILDFQKWIEFLESKGYSNYWKDLNAKDYGVAQNRERCFMISILGEFNYKFPRQTETYKNVEDCLFEFDKKYFLSEEKVKRLLDNKVNCKKRVGNRILGTIYTKTSEKFQRGIFPIARCIKAEKHDLAVVIYENDSFKVKLFSPNECWRLMGFSDKDFENAKEVNSNNQLYKQAGNSIVKDVLIGIFKQLIA